MKILIYCGYQPEWDSTDPNSSNLGGTEKATLELFYKLKEGGHEVMLVGNGFKQYEDDIREYTYFRQDYTTSHWDVVIAVNYAHFFTYLEQGKLTYDKLFFWLHNEEPFLYYRGTEDASLTDALYDDRLDKILTVSGVAANKLAEVHPNIAHKIDYIPNGVNYGMSHIVGNKQKNTFMYSSCPSRGLNELLGMWPAIVDRVPNAELHICFPSYAEENFLDHYADYVDEIRAQVGMDSVVVHGALVQDDLYNLMSHTEYWLYPSNYFETFCITAMEMMAHRVVPIACTAGNVGTIIGDDRGIHIEYTDDHANLTERFVSAIEFAVANPDIIQNRMDNAQSFVQMFDWNLIVNDWLDLFGADHIEVEQPQLGVAERGMVGIEADSEYEETFVEERPSHNMCPIDAVYVMGLDRTANWDEISERIKSMNFHPDVKFHKLPAVDGRNLTPAILAEENVQLWDKWRLSEDQTDNDWWTRDMTMGEIGCALSHLCVWTHAKENRYNQILILEEDFYVKDWYHTFNWKSLPKDFNMFFLGRNAFGGDDAERINDDVVRPFWHYNAHAYMLNRTAIDALIDSNFNRNVIPVDEFLGLFWADSLPRNDIFELPHQKLNVYATPQEIGDLVGQSSVTGVNSTTEGNGGTGDKLHPELYTFWNDRDAWIKRFISPGVVHKEWDLMVDEPLYGVLEMPLFTEEFCVMIREEAEHSNAWTTDRHEFYPTTDMLLQVIDMHDIYMEVLREFVMPMAIHMWTLSGPGWDNMYAENFLARYIPEAQGHLSLHHDNSDITALVNLSKPDEEFEGGGTFFDRIGKVSKGKQGYVSVHPGRITHRHGARPITKGQRYITVSFMSNTELR
ncbi:MAG: glycosyltransferase family 25 protein [Neptunomonas phycophila]|uniref:glycosyltransferase family 25 protein n=1 Tax=Neptunomonas phycophila TaxID=1572645 RepID=UPI003B8E3AD3